MFVEAPEGAEKDVVREYFEVHTPVEEVKDFYGLVFLFLEVGALYA